MDGDYPPSVEMHVTKDERQPDVTSCLHHLQTR